MERRFQEEVDTALSRLQGGESPEDVFDEVWGFSKGLQRSN